MTKKIVTATASAVARAKHLQPALAAATDQLNQKIREFERALASLRLGVAADVRLFSDDFDPAGADLRFSKFGDGWHLNVEYWTEDGPPESWRYELLTNCSREDRLLAIEKFPLLVDALVVAADKEVERVKESSSSIDTLIETLESEAKP